MFITERTQIAKFFNENTVLKINMETPISGFNTIFNGDLVKVLTPSKNHPDLFQMGTLTYFSDEKSFYIQNGGSFVSASFGYSDVIEHYQWSNAPVLEKGKVVAIVEDYPSKQQCRIRVMKVKNVNSMCSTLCYLEECEEVEG